MKLWSLHIIVIILYTGGVLVSSLEIVKTDLKTTKRIENKEMSAELSVLYPLQFWKQNIQEYTVPETSEKWKSFLVENKHSTWVSETGKCIFDGKLLSFANLRGTYSIKQTKLTPAKIVCLAFQLPGWNTLDQKGVVVTLHNDSEPISLENVWVTTKSEITKRNTVARESKGFFDAPVRNGSQGIIFREGYIIYSDGVIMSLLKSSQKEPTELNRVNSQGRNVYRAKRGDNGMYVDILVLMHFGDLKDLSYDEIVTNYEITHKDKDLLNDSIDNLSFKTKNLSIERQRKERVAKRLSDLHQKIVELLAKRGAVLISPKEEITSVNTVFNYRCRCGDKQSNYSNLSLSENCGDCIHQKLRETTSSDPLIYQDFTFEDEHYIRFERGWVTKDAKVINNFKTEVAINKGSFSVGGISYNIKEIMANSFCIPNYEKVDNKKYFVFQIEQGDDYGLTNLVVRTFSDDTVIRRRDHKESIDRQVLNGATTDSINSVSIVSANEVSGLTGVSHPDFPKIKFYENGIIQSSIGNYVRGTLSKYGYRTTNIGGKSYKVHRLICFVFNPSPDKTKLSQYNRLEVDHIDTDKSNNHKTNLRWLPPSENRKAGVEMNLYKANKAICVYKATNDGKKGEKLNEYNTMVDTTKACKIAQRTLSRVAKSEEVYNGFIYAFKTD